MREEKKTVFDYLGQIFMLYGMTVCIFIVFSLTIGDYAKEASQLFSLGDEGLRFSTLLQLLGMATLITLIRNLFFTDILIKNMSVVKRAICMLIGIIVMIIAFVVAFDWFPVNKIEAWIGFFVSFGICFVRMELYAMRMMAIHDLVDENILKLPEDTSKSSLGMHIILK